MELDVSAGLQHVLASRKWALAPVKEMNSLVSESEGRQAKSKRFLLPRPWCRLPPGAAAQV